MIRSVSPFEHACDLSELDYSQVADGLIQCSVCPRQWTFDHYRGWRVSCETRMPGFHGPHFWTADLKPYPKPTPEEILSNRQQRLEMLDQKASEQRQKFEDVQSGLDWLQKERGHGGTVDSEWWTTRIESQKPPKQAVGLFEPRKNRVRLVLRFSSPEAARAFLRKIG